MRKEKQIKNLNKNEFLRELQKALKHLPEAERNSALGYYEEIICDKIEAGATEQQAVESLGDIPALNAYLTAGSVAIDMQKKRPQKRPVKSFFTVLALCTSPVLALVGGILLIVMLALIITFAALALSTFAGSAGALVLSVTNSYYVWQSSGMAAASMSFFACLFASAILCLLGMLCLKLTVVTIKIIVKALAKLVRRRSKKNNKIPLTPQEDGY